MPPRLNSFFHAGSMNPNNNTNRRSRRGGRVNPTVDRRLLQEEIETGALSTIEWADIAQRPINGLISQRPPQNLGNQIFWWKSSTTTTLTLTSGSAPNEVNYSFFLANMPGYAALVTVFDQYCIYSVAAVFTLGNTASVTSVLLHSAIDFDSTNNLGTIFVMQGYTSHHVTVLNSNGTSAVRYCKPCTAPLALNPSAAQPALVQRNWLDSAYTAIPHYGIRSMFDLGTANSATVNVTFTYFVGFRNAF